MAAQGVASVYVLAILTLLVGLILASIQTGNIQRGMFFVCATHVCTYIIRVYHFLGH